MYKSLPLNKNPNIKNKVISNIKSIKSLIIKKIIIITVLIIIYSSRWYELKFGLTTRFNLIINSFQMC
jgi:hypothetical protein